MTKQNKTEKLFAKYVASKKILIADTSGAARAGLAKAMIGLGAKTQNIIMAANFEIAMDAITKAKPNVVICDFDLKGGNGLDLLQQQRKENPDIDQSLFVLVTGNTSQSAVAQAAEEDIDTYILKPYTIEVLRQSIIKATIAKIYPNDYIKKVKEAKKLLFDDKKPDEAMKILKEAIPLDPKPALALFYHGQAEQLKEAIEQAENDYSKGLNHSKIHYKCLVGLFELLMEQKNYVKAYNVVKRISQYFPANPQRLATVLRLAIMTGSYEDIEKYYQSFTSLDQRDDMLVRYVCAALVVCGKYYLKNNHGRRALELFEKAGVASAGRTRILREIIVSLLEFELANEAQKFLARFPTKTEKDVDFHACDYMVSARLVAPALSVEKGRKLISQGLEDPEIHRTLIEASVKANLVDAAGTLSKEAEKKWPKQAKLFQGALKHKKEVAESA